MSFFFPSLVICFIYLGKTYFLKKIPIDRLRQLMGMGGAVI